MQVKKYLPFTIMIILVAAVAYYSGVRIVNIKTLQAKMQGSMPPGMKPGMMPPGMMKPGMTPEVNVIRIKSNSIDLGEEFPARIVSQKIAEIRPQIDGVITKQIFVDGSFVKKGQVLYRVDPADNVAIPAPISGYITRTNFTEGALVTKNQAIPLATISQISPIYVDIPIPSNKIWLVKNKSNVEVSLKIDGVKYDEIGILKSFENLVDKTTDSINLRAEFKNANQKLLPGMFAEAKLIVKSKDETIAIPQRVVDYLPDGSMFVWVVSEEDSKVRQQIVKVSSAVGNKWIVTDGLYGNELLIYEGLQKVFPDAVVKPVIVDVDGVENN